MFEHSIRVPRLFKAAAKIVKQCSETGASAKQLVYQAKHVNIKGIYALAAETMKRKDTLDYLIRKSKILEKETRLDPWLCRVLITELLWGKKKLAGEAKPLKTVLAYKQVLSAHCSDSGEQNEDSSAAVYKPKYVRVNTLMATVEEIIDKFRDEGWTFVRHFDDKNYDNFLTKVKNLASDEFMLDLHVKELLVFPPKTEFYFYPFYKNGAITIQDKASCLPVILLNPEPGSIVMDMCAAPGMKTTQMAALMNNMGTIYAVEACKKRYETLNKIVESAKATCVKTICSDVIELTSRDYQDVEYILVDPSCSGSGMVDRPDFNSKVNVDRLDKLAGFQIKILKTALHRFPKAKRIVYSTCSLYTQENEAVVKEVLASSLKYKLVPADKYLPAGWNNFGSPKFDDIGKFTLYSRPEKDYTNGFFVAVFERLEDGEENSFAVVDLERKPRKKKGVEEDVEIVGVVKLGKDKKNGKNKKKQANNETEVDEKNGRGANKFEKISQNGVNNHKKKKPRNDSDCIEIGEVISIEDDNSEQIGNKKNKNKDKKNNDQTKNSNKVEENHQNGVKKQKRRDSDIILIEDNSEHTGGKKNKDNNKKHETKEEEKDEIKIDTNKTKKRKRSESALDDSGLSSVENGSPKKKKKDKDRFLSEVSLLESMIEDIEKKKRKKMKSTADDSVLV